MAESIVNDEAGRNWQPTSLHDSKTTNSTVNFDGPVKSQNSRILASQPAVIIGWQIAKMAFSGLFTASSIFKIKKY